MVDVIAGDRSGIALDSEINDGFDESAYLAANPDIASAVANGSFPSGRAHYDAHGRFESREMRRSAALAHFDDEFYLLHNPDIAAAVERGEFVSGLHHYILHGATEERAKLFIPACEGVLTGRAETVQPVKDHFSGVTIGLANRPRNDSLVRIDIRGLHAERSVTVDVAAVEDIRSIHVYWDPIVPSRDSVFVITVVALENGEPSEFLLFQIARGLHALIYSPPMAETAFPHAILFSPVSARDLNCIDCDSRETRESPSAITDAGWLEIVEAARENRLLRIQTDYSGDVLHSDARHGGWLDKLLSLDIDYVIDTHGNTLTGDLVERLLDSRLLRINFIIDTLDPEDYPNMRMGGNLSQALDNIRAFMRARNARRPDLEAIFSLVIMRRNITSVEPALELAAELEMSGVSTSFLHVHTSDMTEQSLMLARDGLPELFEQLRNRANELGVNLRLPPLPEGNTPRRGHRPCTYPWESAVVLGNGDVMACNVPGTVMGNIRSSSLAEVWNSQTFQDFRRRVNSGNPPDPCSNCPMLGHPNSFASHVPGLPEAERRLFELRCATGAQL
jgi:radical SAM protein with 4Fe4S-binding SPASM domain